MAPVPSAAAALARQAAHLGLVYQALAAEVARWLRQLDAWQLDSAAATSTLQAVAVHHQAGPLVHAFDAHAALLVVAALDVVAAWQSFVHHPIPAAAMSCDAAAAADAASVGAVRCVAAGAACSLAWPVLHVLLLWLLPAAGGQGRHQTTAGPNQGQSLQLLLNHCHFHALQQTVC